MDRSLLALEELGCAHGGREEDPEEGREGRVLDLQEVARPPTDALHPPPAEDVQEHAERTHANCNGSEWRVGADLGSLRLVGGGGGPRLPVEEDVGTDEERDRHPLTSHSRIGGGLLLCEEEVHEELQSIACVETSVTTWMNISHIVCVCLYYFYIM